MIASTGGGQSISSTMSRASPASMAACSCSASAALIVVSIWCVPGRLPGRAEQERILSEIARDPDVPATARVTAIRTLTEIAAESEPGPPAVQGLAAIHPSNYRRGKPGSNGGA